MPHEILPTCTGCGLCLPECPTRSIALVALAGRPVAVLDTDTCSDFGCCVRVCPYDAIKAVSEGAA